MSILNKVTLKNLLENKTRTLVTIIGIILSAAMFTAVTTSISSLQNYLLMGLTATEGAWQGAAYDVGGELVNKARDDEQVESLTALQNIGYADIGSSNEYKPYLFIAGIEDNIRDLLCVDLISGRMPENSSEILLPRHLKTNGEVNYDLNDVLELEIGDRMSEEFSLKQENAYSNEEKLTIREKKTYTVVGIYERPLFENRSAPGYTALTAGGSDSKSDSYDIYLTLNKPDGVYDYLSMKFGDCSYRVHDALLRYSGQSNEGTFNAVVFNLAAILMGLIMFGSVSLIYNAFSISISERTKQFGLLKSIGATGRQILHSVLFEAAVLSVIGIPIGILAGIAGIAVTLQCTKGLFAALELYSAKVELTIHVVPAAVIIAAAVGAVTVLISAYMPARKAVKLSVIDSIRQTNDIKIRAKKVKTSWLTQKMFGFEGMLASKNFKRSRRKYRATVLSLFLSIVLFVSASSFCNYLTASSDTFAGTAGYDLSYMMAPEIAEKCPTSEFAGKFRQIDGVTKVGYSYYTFELGSISEEYLAPEYIEYVERTENASYDLNGTDEINITACLIFVEDRVYEEYLRENGLMPEEYMNDEDPVAAAFDFIKIYDSSEERYFTYNLLSSGKSELKLNETMSETEDGYYFYEITEDGYYIYKNDEGNTLKYQKSDVVNEFDCKIGESIDNLPFCARDTYSDSLTLLYPYSMIQTVLGENREDIYTGFYAKTSSPSESYDKFYALLEEEGLAPGNLYNYAANVESERALYTIINVFSYGFIVLISLIAAANVFNTISTNISLRRREFAMLRSIGMTQRGFNKMMNFECLLYGVKGIIYGIPVSIGVTYLIYRAVLQGWETGFYIPWYSIAISVGSVFAVVFTTMLYSMNRIKRDNPIDALKNENL